ncbi:hypothetical protein GGS21DRAFT_99537 [Xylaria nigripes]|nr:hypothetical protein GGS21DRAFT_99537 [Xylaria nigripes]
MGAKFFVGWELWEQLTFVLGAGIVSVFIVGWIKLWWSQRLLKKYTILDEEKRTRQMEMRRSGLPVGRRVDIPFGVRAIQSGIEVEGIWISRPATPIEARSASKASSSNTDTEGEPKPLDKGKGVMGSAPKLSVAAAIAEAESSSSSKPKASLSRSGSDTDRSIRQDLERGASPGPYLQSYTPQHMVNDSQHVPRYFNATPQPEDMATHPHIEIYVPTSSGSSMNSSRSPRVRPAVDRMSISSEEGLNLSNPRYPAETRGRLSPYYRVPGDDSVSSSSAGPSAARGKYNARLRAEARGTPFENVDIERGSIYDPPAAARFSMASTRPVPTRNYSDHRDSTTVPRVVNSGFEVLPAGTFGRPSGENGPLLSEGPPGLAR